VFGLHDREKFEINCYSLSPSDGSKWRYQIESDVDSFKDISQVKKSAKHLPPSLPLPPTLLCSSQCQQMHFGDAVNLIRADRVHILINLNGYTKGGSNEIFALRPAPIQVTTLSLCLSLSLS
jgi:predicted O-linked N-acetylglucosamine transferase (SPINDLY family)